MRIRMETLSQLRDYRIGDDDRPCARHGPQDRQQARLSKMAERTGVDDKVTFGL